LATNQLGIRNSNAIIPAVQLPVITGWVAYTPTFSNVTMTGVSGFWRRVGDSMELMIDGNYSSGTTAAAITVSIPAGYNIDSAKLVSSLGNLNTVIGSGLWYDDSAGTERSLALTTNDATTLKFRVTDNTTVRDLYGNEIAASDQIGCRATVPITEWASSGVSEGTAANVYVPEASASSAGLVGTVAQTFAGVKSFPGRTDGSAVSAGYVGETLTDVDTGTTINTSSYTDVCTVTLTPGRWLVYAQCGSTGASQTGIIGNLVTLGTSGSYGTTNLEQDVAAAGPSSVAFQAQVLDVVTGTATKTVVLQMKSKTANGSGRGSITALRIG
jgi:hypothetical protein